jgi:hypothetical protein
VKDSIQEVHTKIILHKCGFASWCTEKGIILRLRAIDSNGIDEFVTQWRTRRFVLERQTLRWRSVDSKVIMRVQRVGFETNRLGVRFVEREASFTSRNWTLDALFLFSFRFLAFGMLMDTYRLIEVQIVWKRRH